MCGSAGMHVEVIKRDETCICFVMISAFTFKMWLALGSSFLLHFVNNRAIGLGDSIALVPRCYSHQTISFFKVKVMCL